MFRGNPYRYHCSNNLKSPTRAVRKGDPVVDIERIKQWFDEKDDNSDMIIDEKWDMHDLNGDSRSFAVSHNNLPFEIGLYIERDAVQITVYSNLETSCWEMEQQRDIYRDLLIRNNKDLFIKYFLAGENGTVALRTEINVENFNKEEFNDALQAVIFGSQWILRKMGVIVEKKCEVNPEEIVRETIYKLLQQGCKKHAIIERLVEDSKIGTKEATEKVFAVAKEEGGLAKGDGD